MNNGYMILALMGFSSYLTLLVILIIKLRTGSEISKLHFMLVFLLTILWTYAGYCIVSGT